jgi:hypothetical protein
MEETGYALFEVISCCLFGEIEEKYEKYQSIGSLV